MVFKYDLVVVLGMKLGPRWQLESDLKTRLDKAIELYQSSQTAHIAVCGRWAMWYEWKHVLPPITEARKMKRYLVKKGIPSTAIVMEQHSKDTIGNAYFLKLMMRQHPGYRHLLIVCARPHLERASFLFKIMFGEAYKVDYLAVEAPHYSGSKKDDKNELLQEQRLLLAGVRPGHDEDLRHRLYNSSYYRELAKHAETQARTYSQRNSHLG